MKTFIKMNLPNKLTTLRMLAVIVFLVLALIPYNGIAENGNFLHSWFMASHENFNIEWLRWTLAGIFIFASLTDYLDGYLARKNNLVTTYGKFMDPIADKLLVNSALILLTAWNIIPLGCTIIMILRDIFVDAIRMLAVSNGKVLAANVFGKVKTVLQMVGLATVFIWPVFNLTFPFDTILIYLATIASLLSGIIYFIQNRKLIFGEGEII
ncbi:MAG: CDP-diacylglycerol--glycerol-3-phosphate 3-phosphatidyltransferase [Bacillales bacterium]|jgi:CDP-diacylglycerol--glycerol-3-phosphate 3-phosphatidyltransferase|nr:CDP-diacylglycerol--glycerol-3-phosphate 3-phosphatidyltransferase [Bacillales bacterium]